MCTVVCVLHKSLPIYIMPNTFYAQIYIRSYAGNCELAFSLSDMAIHYLLQYIRINKAINYRACTVFIHDFHKSKLYKTVQKFKNPGPSSI